MPNDEPPTCDPPKNAPNGPPPAKKLPPGKPGPPPAGPKNPPPEPNAGPFPDGRADPPIALPDGYIELLAPGNRKLFKRPPKSV